MYQEADTSTVTLGESLETLDPASPQLTLLQRSYSFAPGGNGPAVPVPLRRANTTPTQSSSDSRHAIASFDRTVSDIFPETPVQVEVPIADTLQSIAASYLLLCRKKTAEKFEVLLYKGSERLGLDWYLPGRQLDQSKLAMATTIGDKNTVYQEALIRTCFEDLAASTSPPAGVRPLSVFAIGTQSDVVLPPSLLATFTRNERSIVFNKSSCIRFFIYLMDSDIDAQFLDASDPWKPRAADESNIDVTWQREATVHSSASFNGYVWVSLDRCLQQPMRPVPKSVRPIAAHIANDLHSHAASIRKALSYLEARQALRALSPRGVPANGAPQLKHTAAQFVEMKALRSGTDWMRGY